MNRLLIGTGLLLLGVFLYYRTAQSRGEEIPDYLTYALGISACLFFTVLFYALMHHFKKKK